MRQRVLIAEKSDAIRGVAETVLRQNGYEVISVSSAEKALEVLKFSRPDLLIIGADLTTKNNRPFYERVGEEPKAASVPLLLFADPKDESLPHPSDVRIPRPFDTKDFVRRVSAFARPAQPVEETGSATENPLKGMNLGDDMLDQALGLDNLEVMESEIMDKTTTTHKTSQTEVQRRANGQVVSLDDGMGPSSGHGDSGPIVESLHISDDDSTVSRGSSKPAPPEEGLDIVSDHHAYQNPQSLTGHESPDHDYEWFVSSMKQEGQVDQSGNAAGQKSTSDDLHSEELVFQNPSTMVDPVTPPPSNKQEPKQHNKSGNVEKFIDEFRKEVEKFRDDDAPAVPASVPNTQGSADGAEGLGWEESVERLTPKEVAIFTRQVADRIGENVARMIERKLDPDKLLKLLKQEIVDSARRNSNDK